MSRHIYVVRHGERADNVDPKWFKTAPRGAWDDPPLTLRGLQQAQEVGQKFIQENEKIDHVFSSPFTRCMQTASNIIKEINKTQIKQLKIKVEPGFSEALSCCQEPPGCLSVVDLRNEFATHESYKPFFNIENLPQETTPVCCFQRVKSTLDNILSKFSGNILIISHGSPIAGCHIVFTGKFQYVGQCTISKYVIKEILTNSENTQMDKYFCEYAGNSSHLSNQSNLRDTILITKEMKQMLLKHVKI